MLRALLSKIVGPRPASPPPKPVNWLERDPVWSALDQAEAQAIAKKRCRQMGRLHRLKRARVHQLLNSERQR